jgi:hypothetical protein
MSNKFFKNYRRDFDTIESVIVHESLEQANLSEYLKTILALATVAFDLLAAALRSRPDDAVWRNAVFSANFKSGRSFKGVFVYFLAGDIEDTIVLPPSIDLSGKNLDILSARLQNSLDRPSRPSVRKLDFCKRGASKEIHSLLNAGGQS